MCYIDLEPCDLWVENEVTARKPHKCSSCRGVIQPKAKYWTHFSKLDGNITTGRICAACHDDRAEFAAAHEAMLCDPGFFPQMLQDCIHDNEEEDDAQNEAWKAMLERMRERKGTLLA